MNKKIIISILAMGLLALNGCSSRFEREMKQGCYSMGGSRSYCSCVYDKLEDRYGKDTLEAIGDMKITPPVDFESTFYRFGQQCMAER